MKENKQKFWFFDPEQHGGEGNMYIYFASIALGIIGLIIWTIKSIIYAE